MRQGTHHDAQKLTTRGLPRKLLSDITRTGAPMLGSENVGAVARVRPVSAFEATVGDVDTACQTPTEIRRARTIRATSHRPRK